MTQPTEDTLRAELAAIIVVMGRQIELWSNSSGLAARFGGWNADDEARPEEVDLESFLAAKQILAAYRYAFHPTADDGHDLQDLGEFAELLSGLPREDFHSDVHDFPNVGSPSAIEDTFRAAAARSAIDGIDGGMTSNLSIRQLALLADMSEGAVRNAMTLSGEARLSAIPGAKPVSFEIDEARRWLQGRRGYRPTPKGVADDPLMNARLRAFERMEQFTDFVARHAERRHGGIETMREALGWDEALMRTWAAGSFVFDAGQAKTLAEALGAEVATFAGKALELSLRRDLGEAA